MNTLLFTTLSTPGNRRWEATIHVLFWIFIYASVNVDWTSLWFDPSLRPRSPAPLSVLIFPLLFYAHAFWAMPHYLNTRKWVIYGLSLISIFIVPEVLRLFAVKYLLGYDMTSQIFSRDSFLFGSPSIVWMSFLFSSAYRFTRDWFVHSNAERNRSNRNQINELKPAEAHWFDVHLEQYMEKHRPYLNNRLELYDLANALSTSPKKLSTYLNKYAQTNFNDCINNYRIAYFMDRAEEGLLKNLTVSGLAQQSGFASKASFYRAFKKVTGTTPSDYLSQHK